MPRNTRPTTNKTTAKSPSPGLFYGRLAVAVIVILFLAWLLLWNGASRYSANTNEVKQRIQSALDVTNPVKPLASSIVDQGCDSRSSVGLQARISCSLAGYRYFELTGDKKTVLREIDTKLQSLGFKKQGDPTYTNRVLDGIAEGDVSYLKDYTNAQLGWATLPGAADAVIPSPLHRGLTSNWFQNPDKPTAVVGLVAQETYFLCSSGGLGIWGIGGCVFPPHPPNR